VVVGDGAGDGGTSCCGATATAGEGGGGNVLSSAGGATAVVVAEAVAGRLADGTRSVGPAAGGTATATGWLT
jgi:hypothetical protein